MRMLRFPTVHDPSGNLTWIQGDAVPFVVKRQFYLHDVPTGARRGGHAHHELQEVVIALSGSFCVVTRDEDGWHRWPLERPDSGLYIGPHVWRYLADFSSNAVALILASTLYDAADYIRGEAAFVASLLVPAPGYFERRAQADSLRDLQAVER